MSVNGDVLIKIAAGITSHIPGIIAGGGITPGILTGAGIAEYMRRKQMESVRDRLRVDDVNPPPYFPDPRLGRPAAKDYNPPPRPYQGPTKSEEIGRAAGRAARTVRDGAVDTAREVGRSVSDAVRGFGQGWRGGQSN